MGKCTYSRWSASNTLCIRPPHLTLLHHCFPDIFPDQLPWKMQQKNMFELLERRKHHRLVHKKNVTVILYLKWKLLLTSGCSPFSGHACTPGSTGGPLELPCFNLFSSLKIINVLYVDWELSTPTGHCFLTSVSCKNKKYSIDSPWCRDEK
jgi:hypothetical protein